MSILTVFGKRFGIDLWNYETPDGRGIEKAYEYFIPYITTDKKWEYQQLGNLDDHKSDFVSLLERAGKTFNEKKYIELAEQYLSIND